ncbi:IMP dehydrogenase [Streptomyces sp. NPDC042638]|uniref:IMP dehydrogenase n=1 Tax=Streptomyces sp. NPDC042638 TaxID=3154333 RepID=UPI0033DED39B
MCFDSSDGYNDRQAQALTWVKKHYPEISVGGGNVVDGETLTFLAEAGADFVKVGVGGGSICITRDRKGLGRGQASAVLDAAAARDAFRERTGGYVPICSDGGLVPDYHVALALAMGAVQSPARLTLVSDQSFKKSHANVSLRDIPTTVS